MARFYDFIRDAIFVRMKYGFKSYEGVKPYLKPENFPIRDYVLFTLIFWLVLQVVYVSYKFLNFQKKTLHAFLG